MNGLRTMVATVLVLGALASPAGAAEPRVTNDALTASIKNYLGDDYGTPSVEVRKNEEKDISLALVYPQGQPDADTEPNLAGILCAQGMLTAIENAGIDPRNEWMYFSCWVQADAGTDARGEKRGRVFGSAVYDFNTGDITWKPYKP